MEIDVRRPKFVHAIHQRMDKQVLSVTETAIELDLGPRDSLAFSAGSLPVVMSLGHLQAYQTVLGMRSEKGT
jgi:hypothetical protein